MKKFRALLHGMLVCLVTAAGQSQSPALARLTPAPPAAATLCGAGEQVIFSCALRGSAKIVSLCGSKALTRDEGYVQYRFGRPGRVELEFPKDRAGSQKQFRYGHYFRSRFDQTEIDFESGGYGYTLFDYYNGEQKPASREAGVRVRAAGENAQETTLRCGAGVMARYGDLAEILAGQ